MNKNILLLSFFLTCFLLSGCENNISVGDSPLQITFRNSSSKTLENLAVSDINVGDLNPGNLSKKYGFESFTFDTGMPDEDASAFVEGRLLTNFFRGFWCGTEKITIEKGDYLIEIEVVDTVLFLKCENAPTIFDP